jgi:hypothetical protein
MSLWRNSRKASLMMDGVNFWDNGRISNGNTWHRAQGHASLITTGWLGRRKINFCLLYVRDATVDDDGDLFLHV